MLYLFLFLAGGLLYVTLECFWRGHSHVSMAIAGGVCAVLLYGVLTRIPNSMLLFRAVIGAIIITSVEFITGAIVNIKLHLHVWDYSSLPANVYGQICAQYSVLWMLLCVPATVFIDVIYRLHAV